MKLTKRPQQMAENIWIIDDDKSIRWVLQKALDKAGMNVTAFEFPNDLLRQLRDSPDTIPDVIITDIRMPSMDGFELLKEIKKLHPMLPVIIMTAHSDMDSAMSAYDSGAFEYLPKPFDINEAIELARRASSINQSTGIINETVDTLPQQNIIGKSVAMQELFRTIGRLSKTSISVLITGESGTGKELVAKALHTHSPRSDKAFIAINTAAIPKDLLESELFGHEKGSFTGAQTRRIGRFEQAHEGTLFLDEIGDMPAELQTRLLRVLADGEFYRVGGTQAIKVDVRVLAATHQNLEEHVRQGKFREDLYYRLNVIRLQIPPLRDRDDDIILLLNHFLMQASIELDMEQKVLSSEVSSFLQTLEWSGNVRQLDNISRWLTVMATSKEITLDDLPQDIKNSANTNSNNWEQVLHQHLTQRLNSGELRILDEITPTFEAIALNAALQKTGGMKKEAAELLGWGRNTLTRKLKDLKHI